MTHAKKKIEFRNTTGSPITISGGFTLAASGGLGTVFDTNAFTAQILSDCRAMLADSAGVNANVGNGSIVVVKDSVDLSITDAWEELQCIRECMEKYDANEEQHWISSGVNV